jgi:molybdate transport system substrate-binding protein
MAHSACIGVLALAVLGAVAVAACGGGSNSNGPGETPGDGSAAVSPSSAAASSTKAALSGSVTVFAAASLTDAFNAIGKEFEQANPGTKITFSFAGSSTLATQITEGAPADVFASADTKQMKVVTDEGNATAPVIFATNVPVVVAPKGDTRVQSFADLAKPGVKLVLAAPTVPIGNYARTIFANASGANGISATFSADVLKNLQSNETNVKAVIAKIQVGEADAGVVYTTDAAAATGEVTTIAIPKEYNVVAEYPMAVLKTSSHLDVAEAFVQYVTSGAGQAILKGYGFGGAG